MTNNGRSEVRVPAFDDVVDRILRFDSFQVGERIYSAELLIPMLTIRTADLLAEASACAALVLYWGVEAARARRQHAAQDAAYRAWRDRAWLEAKTAEDGARAPSDATCERIYRTKPEYGEWQRRIAMTQESADCAEAVHEAFRVKAQLIRDQREILRDEAGGCPYFVVENRTAGVPRQPKTE